MIRRSDFELRRFCLDLYLYLNLLVAGLAAAQPTAPPDSLGKPVAPDSTRGTGPDSTPYRPPRSPGTAVLLSFLLPGAGQVYTGNWWKAALIAPAEVTLGYFSVKEHRSASDYLSLFALHHAESDSANYVRHRDARTTFLWLTGAVLAFSMADAYVSAQMYGFDREVKLTGGFTIDDSRLTSEDSEHSTFGVRAGIAVGL